MSSPSERAGADAKIIAAVDHAPHGGAFDAYQLLMADYKNSGNNGDYLKNLSHDLVDNKTLPDLQFYIDNGDSTFRGAVKKSLTGTPDTPVPPKADSLNRVETTTADVLAKDGNVLESVRDANGNIDKTHVDALLKSMPAAGKNDSRAEKDIRAMLQGLDKNWDSLAKEFSHDGGKTLNLDELTKAGFHGKQNFDDRLKRDGNEKISIADAQQVYDFCKQNPSFLTDANGVITKAAVDQAYNNVKDWPPSVQKVVNNLHNSYESLCGDDHTIHVRELSGSSSKY